MEDYKIFKKYGIILIIFFFLKIILIQTILPLYFKYIDNGIATRLVLGIHQSIIYGIGFLCNFILIGFLLSDISRKNPLKWIIIVLTFLLAEVGVMFYLISELYYKKDKNVA
jgi:hypothetical protein